MQVVTILGSNSGNKRQLITEAIRILSSTEQWVMASSFYETAPWGFECDENFLNQVVVFQTRLSAFDFLQRCLETEKRLGRIRLAGGPRYSSRPIDIDLLSIRYFRKQSPPYCKNVRISYRPENFRTNLASKLQQARK